MPTTAKGTPYVVSTDLVANYPTVSSDLADHIDDKLAYNAVTINAQTGSGANAYTFALADASEGKLVTASNAATATYTVPPQSSVTWADGAVLRILNQGAGIVTIAGGSGVTINGTPLTLAQYRGAAIQRTASNTWTFIPFTGGVGNADFSDTATGTYTDGNGIAWKYKDYNASGNLTISTAGLFEVMVLAGGGGGGGSPGSGSYGGGGGAGGYLGFGTFTNARYTQPLFITTGTYTITVGAGGAGGASGGNTGSFGNDSSFGGTYIINARRGAPGTIGSSNNTLTGGCGGGGASGGDGIPGQGYNGAGQGGGAAGGGGGIGGAANAGTAGAGLAINITGSSVTYGVGGASTLTYTTVEIGGGGDGYAGFSTAGQAGGNGRVIVRVRTN